MDNANDALYEMSRLVTDNMKTVSALGACRIVLGKFINAALPHLTTLQRAEATRSFRQGVEEAMSLMDDVALAAEYHSAMLELTNTVLAALGQELATRE
ncbi:hypothetical protein [Paraburkholderia sp.]|uniref:hypothetical protein n=1 Tax=Paraburkholderia sp. TaxID=1926495 RepID=UPI003C40FE08